MKSTCRATGLGYVYEVFDEQGEKFLTIEVSNIRQRNGSPIALLSTGTTILGARIIPGSLDKVHNGEVWLLSDRSRGEYANALANRIPTPAGAAAVEWNAVLEELVQRVLESESAPVRVVRLGTGEVQRHGTPHHDLVEGMIPAQKATILYGPGGVGKSIFAAALAVAVESGLPFLDLPTTPAKVLYLDWETDEEDIDRRVTAAAKGMGLDTPPPILYVSLVRPIEDLVTQLARLVLDEGIGLVIIDSTGMAMNSAKDGADASETAIRFFRALRSLNVAVVAIDHVAGEDMRRTRGAPKPYGSVYKWNSARNAFELRERKDADQHGSHLLLKHRKSNWGPLMTDMALLLAWTNGAASITRERWSATPRGPLDEQITDILTSGPASPHALSELLSDADVTVREAEVRNILKGLIYNRKVTVVGDGTIRLADPPQTVSDSSLLPGD